MNHYRARCAEAAARRRVAYQAWQRDPTPEAREAFHQAHRAYDDAVHAGVWTYLPGGLVGETVDPTPRPWYTLGRRV